ncbi:sigma-70 family RNA polymerase sigma factor [Promicromonospora sp. MEB111]|jgi:RNA polymerase sigma-70 factor (ECF subfamily)|uniref:sigma-70 family RNA polymerase sigma factor n=1 Tax=unclassified Promicromonospora TaxID=2647929 RepID=UPI00254D950A|nr:sigma-70 family RNA polymerase sigma factor [Promicromonospora sp. MEB111]
MTTHEIPTGPAEHDAALSVFLAQRTQLVRIARRVTGNPAEADDVVQEAWVRWQRTDRTKVRNPAAFLTSTTTNLALNVIQSARYRRESLLSTVPVPDAARSASDQDPGLQAEQTGAAEEAFALLLTRLTPGELAAYVLRRGFDYPYADLARLLRTSAANSRQLVSRAQARLVGDRARPVSPTACRRLVAAFLDAARNGDLGDLERLLVADDGRSATPPAAAA